MKTVADGDCGLDVMCLIMGVERTLHERTALREELSDYLISRLNEPWMIDILIVTQELDPDDVKLARSEGILIEQELMDRPEAFETAVAAIARDDGCELEPVSEEAMDAVRWASKLNDDCGVLDLVRALPNQVVQEQIRLWNASKTAVVQSVSLSWVRIQLWLTGMQSRNVSNTSARRLGCRQKTDCHVV